MARMLGRHRRHKVRDCRTMEHLCGKCSDGDETRAFKRREQRAVRVLITEEERPAAFFDERDLAAVSMFEGDD